MIVIIGDSFCADFYHPGLSQPKFEKQSWIPDQASWVSDVIKHYNGDVEVYGFGGCSWWYSWSRAVSDLINRWDQVQAVVFCHTSMQRINNGWNDNLTQTTNQPPSDSEESRANQLFFKHIYDADFQQYAFDRHIQFVDKKFAKIKTIHFTVCDESNGAPDLGGLLGTVFTTPLMQITIGGLTGSEQKIMHQIVENDPVPLNNHFTAANNGAFARLVIDAIDNYIPGYKEIDFDSFGFDLPNTNGRNWPNLPWASA